VGNDLCVIDRNYIVDSIYIYIYIYIYAAASQLIVVSLRVEISANHDVHELLKSRDYFKDR